MTRRAPAGRSRGRIVDAVALLVIVAGAAWFGARRVADARRGAPTLAATLEVVETDAGRRVRLPDDRWRAACAAVGLPELPSIDGADPEPARALLEAFDAWAATRDPAAVGRIGLIEQGIEEHAAALRCFAAASVLDPGEPLWTYHLGVEAQALALTDLAVEMLERSGRAEPDHAVTWARLGALYLEQGDLNRAAERYARSVEFEPDHSLGHVGLGRVALARRDTEAAEAHLRRAVAATPGDFLAHRLLARALAANGREAEARREAAIAERLPRYQGWSTHDPRVRESRAIANTQAARTAQLRAAADAGDWTTFVAIAEDLVRRRPADDDMLANLIAGYRKVGRLDDATRRLEHELERRPGEIRWHVLQAEIALSRGDHALVRRATDAALAVDPDHARALEIRGRSLFLAGRGEESVAILRRAADADPGAVEARLVLAEVLHRLGRTPEAIDVLRVLAEERPEEPRAAQMLRAFEGGAS